MGQYCQKVMKWAYRSVDLMVDIGPDMRQKLQKYNRSISFATLTPWALVEPDRPGSINYNVSSKLFGKNAELTLLYSGNLGKAHSFKPFVDLARFLRTRNPCIKFCFACRGNRENELRKEISSEDKNITFAGFCCEKELFDRLSSADIHLLSLREEWEGIVVPSKFFGSLAVGRPVLYAGRFSCAIAQWIQEFNVGWILNNNREAIANLLLDYAENRQKLKDLQENTFKVYHKHFSKKFIMNQWAKLLEDNV